MRQDTEAAYSIFRILRDGERLYVATRADSAEAQKLVDWFAARWPGEYVIDGPAKLKPGTAKREP